MHRILNLGETRSKKNVNFKHNPKKIINIDIENEAKSRLIVGGGAKACHPTLCMPLHVVLILVMMTDVKKYMKNTVSTNQVIR